MRAHGAALALVGALTFGACASEAGPDLAGGHGEATTSEGTTTPDDGAPDATPGAGVGEFAATNEYLAGVARGAEGDSYRIAVDMAMHGSAPGEPVLEMGGQFMTGEVAGERSSTVLDMRSMMEDVGAGELLASDLTMTMVTDGETLYVQAPLFRAMAEQAYAEGATPDDLGPIAAIADLGEGEWGSVDLSGLSMAEVAQTTGAQGVNADVFLDMAAAGSDVEDLGTQQIRGVETRGLGAVSTYEDMLTAQGVTVDEFRDQFSEVVPPGGGGPSDAEVQDVFDALLEIDVPLEVWVDAEDDVRRVSFSLDMTDMFAGLEELAPEMGSIEMSIDMSMDMFDYGEPIEIEIPTAATDVTDEFVELNEQGGLGVGPGAGPMFS